MTYQIHILPSCQVLFILFFSPYPRLLFLLLSLLFFMECPLSSLLFFLFLLSFLIASVVHLLSFPLFYSFFTPSSSAPPSFPLPSPSPPPLFLCLLSFLYPSNSSPPFFCVHLAYLSSPLFNRFSSTSYIFLLFFVFIFSLLLFISLIFVFIPFSFRFPSSSYPTLFLNPLFSLHTPFSSIPLPHSLRHVILSSSPSLLPASVKETEREEDFSLFPPSPLPSSVLLPGLPIPPPSSLPSSTP